MIQRFNKKHFIVGTILGVVIPLVLAFVLGMYFTKSSNIDWAMLYRKKMLSPLISLAAIFNMVTFYIGIRQNKLSFARGVLAGTMLSAGVVLVLKFLAGDII